MWVEAPWPVLKHCPRFRLEELRKTIKNGQIQERIMKVDQRSNHTYQKRIPANNCTIKIIFILRGLSNTMHEHDKHVCAVYFQIYS
jgi:hypothetical protein